MLNPVEELKKYCKIDLEHSTLDYMNLPDIRAQNKQFIDEVNKLSKNQFRAVQKIEDFSEEIIELLEEKMNKWEALENALSDKDEIISSLKTRIEKENIEKHNIIIKTINIIDIFDNVASFIEESNDKSWVEQIRKVMDNIKALMSEMGIVELDRTINIFNENIHEAAGLAYDNNKSFRELISIETKGYTYNGKLLRKAKVIVNNIRKDKEYCE